MKKTDFVYSQESEPHRIRTKKILKQFPDLRKLIGKNPNTIFAIIGLVAFQVVLAWLLRDQSWWLIVGAAYLLGAFADHALFVMIHECTHQLCLKTAMPTALHLCLPICRKYCQALYHFEKYHIKHHSFQGVHELDADLPNRWEAKLISNSFFGKALWLLFFPVFQLFRLSRLREIHPFDGWIVTNFLIQVVFTAAICLLYGLRIHLCSCY
jgi:sphingolipid delta-4 desaturase